MNCLLMTRGVCLFPSVFLHLTVMHFGLFTISSGCSLHCPPWRSSLLWCCQGTLPPRSPVLDSASAWTPNINAADTLRAQSPPKKIIYTHTHTHTHIQRKTNFLYLFISFCGAWARESLERQVPGMFLTCKGPLRWNELQCKEKVLRLRRLT